MFREGGDRCKLENGGPFRPIFAFEGQTFNVTLEYGCALMRAKLPNDRIDPK